MRRPGCRAVVAAAVSVVGIGAMCWFADVVLGYNPVAWAADTGQVRGSVLAVQMGETRQDGMAATPAAIDELVVTVGSDQRVFARVPVDTLTRSTCVHAPAGARVRYDRPDSSPLQLGSRCDLFSAGVPGGAGADSGRSAAPSTSEDVDVTAPDDGALWDLLGPGRRRTGSATDRPAVAMAPHRIGCCARGPACRRAPQAEAGDAPRRR